VTSPTREDTPHDSVPPVRAPARGLRIYSSIAGAARARRPTDILLLVAGVLILLALWWPAPGPTTIDTDATNLLGHLRGFWQLVWDISFASVIIWPALLVVIVLFSRGRRRLLVDFLLSLIVAAVIALTISRLAGSSLSDVISALGSAGPPEVYMTGRIALATAVIVTASPYLSRPLRVLGRIVLLLGAIAAVALGAAYPIGVLAAFAVGLVAGTVIHLLLGSPAGELSPQQVTDAAAELGLTVTSVRRLDVQIPGVLMMTGTGEDGQRLLIKVFGRDAWDSEFLGSLWSGIVRRGERPSLGRSREAQLEHEALATMMAERADVPVWTAVKVGSTADGDAILISLVDGRNFYELTADQIDDQQLQNAWRALVALHNAGLSHGRIDRHRLITTGEHDIALADFAEAQLIATADAQFTDRARLLATTAACTTDQRAVAAALDVIGPNGLTDVLPYLQPAVLDKETRGMIKAQTWDLKTLRTTAATAAKVDLPPLQKLNRVTWKSIAIAVGGTLLAYLLISKLVGVDFAALANELKQAEWGWVAAALLISPLVQAAYAVGTMGASSKPVRYLPVTMLQYAIQFLAVTVPSAAAKYALDVRFFQKFGMPAAAALSIGVIDSSSGFIVQILLIAVIALTALPGLTSPLFGTSGSGSTSSVSGGASLLVVAGCLLGIVLITAVVMWFIPSIRRRIKAIVPKWRASLKEQASSASSALVVYRRPKNLTQMFVGNLGAQILQGVVLGLCLHAFGGNAYLSQMVLINTLVMLFAGFMPVPGGVGVAEAGYVACLQAIGVPSAVAMSTALLYRLATFYLPPIWGGFAMAWLKRYKYV
jgi:uncharacterized protein (TIRG00374 family)